MGKYEVTQSLWQVVMGSNPSKFKGDDLPVEQVSWNDCQEFVSKLNSMTGRMFRLPTEAEWEYAARGGKKSRGYQYSGNSKISNVAWYDGNSARRTHSVGTKQANEYLGDKLQKYIATGGMRKRLNAFLNASCVLSKIHASGLVYCDISEKNMFASFL